MNSKYLIVLILLFFLILSFPIWGKDYFDLTWDAVSENVDGSPITDLAGYKIYRNGEMIAAVTKDTLTYRDADLASGGYCYEVTAFDESGNESAKSNMECGNIDTILPEAPANLRIQ